MNDLATHDNVDNRVCPDGGKCWHQCTGADCWRVYNAGPLSGVYPNNEWPEWLDLLVKRPDVFCGH